MKCYKYLPLNEANEEIRMLSLHPGPFDSPIHISLSNVRFPKALNNKSDIPDYEALSYTWGPVENPVDIIVQSPGGDDGSLAVTRNLAAALPYLRYPDKARTIWIDAIAVNQKDLNERSSQVRRMADIFTKARRVVVWLGCESSSTALALNYISAANSEARIDWKSLEVHTTTSDSYWASGSIPLRAEESEASALLEFFSSSWFERLWIRQEITLAPPNSIVMCGSLSIPWESVRGFIYLLSRKLPPDVPSGLPLDLRMSSVFYLCFSGFSVSLNRLLRSTKNCKCTDPRDRIFAILSMLREEDFGNGIEPDYTKTVPEVYTDAVVWWSTFRGKLDILESCSLDRRLDGAPSWVPNFMIPDSRGFLGHCNATSGMSSVFTFQGGVLEVLGLSVARVGKIGPSGFVLLTVEDIVLALKSIIGQYLPHDELPTESGRFQSICQLIMQGSWAEIWNPPKEHIFPRKDQIFQTLLKIQTTCSLPEPTAKENQFLSLVVENLRGKTIFMTEEGRLGLGPETMQVGDVVAIFLGRGPATILRPGSSQFHELVGDAYCDGLMDGEALLGPLPGQWERVDVQDEEMSSWWTAFVDRGTGATQTEDPRLGDLPKGWSRKSHEKERFWTQFVNDEGEVSRKDPRLFPKALRDRGVDLRVFRLV